jgi:hypothetical protein
MTARSTIALAALCAAALPATADAGTPTRKFRVEVEGVQVTKWKEHYTATRQCDQSANGAGTERVTFESRRPTKIVARRYGKNFVLFGNGQLGDDEVEVHAKIKRNAAIPVGDLFNRKLRKHIVIGRGKRVSKSATSDYKTTVRWTVSLTAPKRKRHK